MHTNPKINKFNSINLQLSETHMHTNQASSDAIPFTLKKNLVIPVSSIQRRLLVNKHNPIKISLSFFERDIPEHHISNYSCQITLCSGLKQKIINQL